MQNETAEWHYIEGEWPSEPAPAGLPMIGFPSNADKETHGAIKIP
jgi:cytochrome bd ubiquinol oxidase subunit I